MLEYADYYILTDRFLVAWRREEREGGGNDHNNKLQKDMKKLLGKNGKKFLYS